LKLDLVAIDIALRVIGDRVGSLHTDIRDEPLLLADFRGGELVLVLRVENVLVLVVPSLVDADAVVTAVALVFPLLSRLFRQARLRLDTQLQTANVDEKPSPSP